MAIIRPFQGMRYDLSVVGDLSDVVSPPYDVISPADRVYYHQKHPNNFVRLVLGEELLGDNQQENRFTRARKYLDDWSNNGVFKQEQAPAIYVYEQEYTKAGQTLTIRGFTLLVRIEDYANGVILPHENTLAKPKSDLIKLIRATEANFDSIYGLYPDKEQELTSLLDDSATTTPDAEAYDKDSVRHRLWVIDDPAQISKVAAFLADKEIVIADGHHRYETSMAYRNEARTRDGSTSGEEPYDFVMMTIVNVYGKDVVIFPTHRMVGNLPDEAVADLLPKLSDKFSVEQANGCLSDAMAARNGKAIGLFTTSGSYLLTLKVDPQPLINKDRSLCELDLTVLHSLILDDTLGIDEAKLAQQTNVTYTRDEQEAVSRVSAGEFQMAFIMNPVNVETTLNIARAGEKMPQKATYFYPKLISGLALRRM